MKIQQTLRRLIARIGMISFIFLASYFLASPASAALFGNSEYQSADPFGNAQIPCFNRAMNGGRPLTPEEEALLLGNLPLKETGHYYGRISGNTGTLVLDRVTNRSSTGFVLTSTRARLNQVGLELALGYFYDKSSRLELEYLVNRNLVFTTTVTPLFDPGLGNFTATISTNTFLFNGYWDFKVGNYDRFRPFLTVGIGPSFNSVRTTGTSVTLGGTTFSLANRSRQGVSFAFAVGLGFRFNVFTRWNIVASLRYINLGRVFIEPIDRRLTPRQIFSFQASYYYVPISLGVIYIF